MRQSILRSLLTGAVLAAIGLCGCDTKQPLTQGEKTLEIDFTSTGTVWFVYDVWDKYKDSNSNGRLDEDDELIGIACDPGRQLGAPITELVPLTFSVEIVVLRNGSLVRTLITEPRAVSEYTSSTRADQTPVGTPAAPGPISGEQGFFYRNGRTAKENSVEGFECAAITLGATAGELRLPNFGGVPPKVQVELAAGDTVIVHAGVNPEQAYRDLERCLPLTDPNDPDYPCTYDPARVPRYVTPTPLRLTGRWGGELVMNEAPGQQGVISSSFTVR